MHKRGVVGVGEEVGVGAVSCDAPVIEEQDPVGQQDGRQSVSDHHERGVLGAEIGEDFGLDRGVDGGGGVVEQQHLG